MCDFLFLIEKINKITMMNPRGTGGPGRHRAGSCSIGSSAGLWGQAQGEILSGGRGGGKGGGTSLDKSGDGAEGTLTWGSAPELQQPGPAQPPLTARPWRSQSRPPLSHLPGPPAVNGPDQRQTSAHSSSVCLWMRDGQGVRAEIPICTVHPQPWSTHKLHPLGKV